MKNQLFYYVRRAAARLPDNQRGVTLVELAIVIGVLAIIITGLLAFGNFGGIVERSRVSSGLVMWNTLDSALEVVTIDTGCRANTLDYLVTVTNTNNSCASATVSGWEGPYVNGVRFDGVTVQVDNVQTGAYFVLSTLGSVRSLEFASEDGGFVDAMAEKLCGGTAVSLAQVSSTSQCGTKVDGTKRVLMRYMSK